MSKKIPIADAKHVAEKNDLKQVIIFGWDGNTQFLASYGKTQEDCDQAAQGSETLQKALNWPKVQAEPSRVKKHRLRFEKLATAVRNYIEVTTTRPGGESAATVIPANRNREELDKARQALEEALKS